METYSIKNLTFNYPNTTVPALNDVSLSIQEGDFVLLCGGSGSGKSTLLRHLKTVLTPHGERTGEILFQGKPLDQYSGKEQARDIGFVSQHPEDQIVTDKVWHELAFGLESIGESQEIIRRRVAEMANYFGMEHLFHSDVMSLSGGQKQLLNLASVMAMNPQVLILDEPTSQLDPIAASDFLNTIKKLNNELGITVIISEHRLEEAMPLSNRVIVMDGGKIVVNDAPRTAARALNLANHKMWQAMPTATRIGAVIAPNREYALTVNEGRGLISTSFAEFKPGVTRGENIKRDRTVLKARDLFFRYEREGKDILKKLNLELCTGEIYGLVGGNGAGKSTLLAVLSGAKVPYRGMLTITNIQQKNGFYGMDMGVAMLDQDPRTLFSEDTVLADLETVTKDIQAINRVAEQMKITEYLTRHPYDLSGGEQQRAAMAKVLLTNPRIMLLDEPTKGMDAHVKSNFGKLLVQLASTGITILIVSHDIEFIAEYANRAGLMFDGGIVSQGEAREFFANNSFYTTAANRIARKLGINAVLTQDVIDIIANK